MGPIGGSRRPPQPRDTWGQVPSLVPSGTELRWAGREAASPECLIHRKGCFGLSLSAHFLSGHLPVTFGRQNQRALGNSQPPGLLLSE